MWKTCHGRGERGQSHFFQPTMPSLDHFPLFHLAGFIFTMWAGHRLRYNPPMYQPPEGIYFLTFWPLILVFDTDLPPDYQLYFTDLLNQNDFNFSYKIQNNLFSILLYQQKKFHCINYVLLFSCMLSSEITLKSDAIYWHCFFYY